MLRYSGDELEDALIKFFLGHLALVPATRRVAGTCALILLAGAVVALGIPVCFWAFDYCYDRGVIEACYGPPSISLQHTAHGIVYDLTEDALSARVLLGRTRSVNASFGVGDIWLCYHGPYGRGDDELSWMQLYTPAQLQEANRAVFLMCPTQHSCKYGCKLGTSFLKHWVRILSTSLNVVAAILVPLFATACVLSLFRVLFILIERRNRRTAESADGDEDDSA
jgi:hypothetical protein